MGNHSQNRLELLGDRALIEAVFELITPVLSALKVSPAALADRELDYSILRQMSEEEEETNNLRRTCAFSQLEGLPISLELISPCPSKEELIKQVQAEIEEERVRRTGWKRWAGAVYDWLFPHTLASLERAADKLETEWKMDHWGTMCDVFDTADQRIGDSQLFSTGDAPPIAAIRTLSRRFPTLTFILEWFADADLTPSRLILQNGIDISQEAHEIDSPQGKDILYRLGIDRDQDQEKSNQV